MDRRIKKTRGGRPLTHALVETMPGGPTVFAPGFQFHTEAEAEATAAAWGRDSRRLRYEVVTTAELLSLRDAGVLVIGTFGSRPRPEGDAG